MPKHTEHERAEERETERSQKENTTLFNVMCEKKITIWKWLSVTEKTTTGVGQYMCFFFRNSSFVGWSKF